MFFPVSRGNQTYSRSFPNPSSYLETHSPNLRALQGQEPWFIDFCVPPAQAWNPWGACKYLLNKKDCSHTPWRLLFPNPFNFWISLPLWPLSSLVPKTECDSPTIHHWPPWLSKMLPIHPLLWVCNAKITLSLWATTHLLMVGTVYPSLPVQLFGTQVQNLAFIHMKFLPLRLARCFSLSREIWIQLWGPQYWEFPKSHITCEFAKQTIDAFK